MSADTIPSVSTDNPLREFSALPFGLPPFADITEEHCREALLAGMAEQRAEVAGRPRKTTGKKASAKNDLALAA